MRQPPKPRYVVKPTIRMHEDQWDGTDYTLYSPRLEPRGPEALPPPLPKDEYSIGNVFKKETNIFAEYTGLYGFVAKSAYQGRSLRPAGHKNPRAGASEAGLLDSVPLPHLFSAAIREGRDRMVSSSCRATKYLVRRASREPDPSSGLWGRFGLSIYIGRSGIGSVFSAAGGDENRSALPSKPVSLPAALSSKSDEAIRCVVFTPRAGGIPIPPT